MADKILRLFTYVYMIALCVPLQAAPRMVQADFLEQGSSAFRNFIRNGEIEKNDRGWVAYDDAAAIPVDCTGGSPSSTLTVTGTTPLAGDFSLNFNIPISSQGEGFSYDYKIDEAEKGHIQRFKMLYKLGIAAEALKVYIYDIDAAELLYPSQQSFDGSGKLITEYQPNNSTSDDFRVCVHVAENVAAAATNKFDSFFLGPRQLSKSLPPASLYATVTYTEVSGCQWSDSGNNSPHNYAADPQCTARTAEGAGAVPTTLIPGIRFPNGLPRGTYNFQVEGAFVGNRNTAGSAACQWRLADGTFNAGFLEMEGADFERAGPLIGTVTLENDVTSDTTWQVQIARRSAGDSVCQINVTQTNQVFRIKVFRYPLDEEVTSSDFGNRVIAASVEVNAVQSVPNSAVTRLQINNVKYDTTSSWSVANDQFDCPEAGYYNVDGQSLFANNGASGLVELHIVSSAETYKTITNKVSGEYAQLAFSRDVYCKSGESISLEVFQTTGGALDVLNIPDFTGISIHKIQSPETLLGDGLNYGDKVVAQGAGGANTFAEGTATPTGGSVFNVNSISGVTMNYVRIGKTVSVGIRFGMDVASGGNFQGFINMPSFVENNFTSPTQCSGTFVGEVGGGTVVRTGTIAARSGQKQILVISGLTEFPGAVQYNGSFVCRLQ